MVEGQPDIWIEARDKQGQRHVLIGEYLWCRSPELRNHRGTRLEFAFDFLREDDDWSVGELLSTAWPAIRLRTREIDQAIAAVQPREIVEVPIRAE